jgi:hypothetical protein
MAPGGTACIRRPRSATRASASSREKTPARWAATYSPTLWPIMATGSKPHAIQSRASAYSITKSAGWVSLVCLSSSAAASASPGCG